MVGALAAEKSGGEQLDLSSSCWNVTVAAQRDGAAVTTAPADCIHGKSAANALYCTRASTVLRRVTVVVRYIEIKHFISTKDILKFTSHLTHYQTKFEFSPTVSYICTQKVNKMFILKIFAIAIYQNLEEHKFTFYGVNIFGQLKPAANM